MSARFTILLLATLSLAACQEASGPENKIASYILADSLLPDYERQIDHRGIVSQWTEEFYHKGMITYRNNCFSCHGNIEQEGSIPNSRQFWSEAFKNGSDPYSMYQVLSRGYGNMPPQVHLTPIEKYEVIHFIREEFLKQHNPEQYFDLTEEYLSSIPEGDTRGPDPEPYHPWADMDYGNFLIQTYELANSNDPPREISGGRSPLANEDYRDYNFAYKGIAIRLDPGEGGIAKGNTFALFDHDLLRFTGFWTGEGFIDYESILLNDRHNIYPRTVGSIQVENPITPGWANPKTGKFDDPRFVAVDGRPFGPLPRQWAHYKGLYSFGDEVVIKYTVANASVLEKYDLVQAGENPIISRTLNVSGAEVPLKMRIAPLGASVVAQGASLAKEGEFYILKVAPGEAMKIKIYLAANGVDIENTIDSKVEPEDLSTYTKGGSEKYPQVLSSPVIKGNDKDAYAVDILSLPFDNPWKSRMRPTGIDFINDGKEAVVCTIDGEVWRLGGITQNGPITWKRIATGMFQPLGIKVRDGEIFVTCRDQLVVLRDLNGDGETDFYESFNSDHQVTEHFHEFAMGLQTDEAGNFYYAKSGRHARTALIPQHGTLIKVSADGKESNIIATGFRAANGVCINPDGSFIVTDQEGYWNPMNRINWVEEGGFYGNMYGYGAPEDSTDQAMSDPLVWIDRKYDRSPGELLWAESNRWGPLNNHLLNLSYGNGKIFTVMTQEVDNKRQAGIIELPVPQFPTGIMRARFNPLDGQMYTAGMSAWATNQMIQVGGLYRVRYTGNPLNLPLKLAANTKGLTITFSDPLDKSSISPKNFTVNTWELLRSRRYGSERLDEKELEINTVTVSEDGRTVTIELPTIQATWCMEILYDLRSGEGKAIKGAIQNTIYSLEGSNTSSFSTQ